MKKNYLIAFLCILILMFSGCATTGEEEEIEANTENQWHKELSDLRRDHKILQEEYQYLQKLAAEAVDIILEEELDQNQLIRLAQTQWEYNITLYETDEDGLPLDAEIQQLNSLTTVEVGANFIISIEERWSTLDILPYDIEQFGSIEDSCVDHMQIVSPKTYDTSGTAGGTVVGMRYHFTDVPTGTEIKLKLTHELQSRLDHPSGTITIDVQQNR